MKQLVAALALFAALALPAIAAPGGLSGRVVDAYTHQGIANVPVAIYRMPYQQGNRAVAVLRTDRHGNFATIGLAMGRYVVIADMQSRLSSCAVNDDVFDGALTHVQLSVGARGVVTCSGEHVSAVPSPTQDVTFLLSP